MSWRTSQPDPSRKEQAGPVAGVSGSPILLYYIIHLLLNILTVIPIFLSYYNFRSILHFLTKTGPKLITFSLISCPIHYTFLILSFLLLSIMSTGPKLITFSLISCPVHYTFLILSFPLLSIMSTGPKHITIGHSITNFVIPHYYYYYTLMG